MRIAARALAPIAEVTPSQRAIGTVPASELAAKTFAAGSMGPKVDAAVDFVRHTGKRAAIGTLADVGELAVGTKGTNVVAG